MTGQRTLPRELDCLPAVSLPQSPKGVTDGFLRNGRQLEVGGSGQKYIATAACHSYILCNLGQHTAAASLPLLLSGLSDNTLMRSEEKAVF